MSQALSRRLLLRASSLAGASMLVPFAGGYAQSNPKFIDYPFKLGVASGDPMADGFVIWTRLAPDLYDPLAVAQEPIVVDWTVANDEQMTQVAARGRAYARPEDGFAVHVEVRDLPSDRVFFYQFKAGSEVSRVGRTRTMPPAGAPMDSFRFGHASCQHYEQGFFTPYRDMIDQDVDMIIHLGDYIYESTWGIPVRRHVAREPETLLEYRAFHAQYKSDPWMQDAHAYCPWLVTWDDHEVDNDYADEMSENPDEQDRFVARRAAAYKAYWENMPIRRSAMLHNGNMRIYQRSVFGDLIEIDVVDTRQYRSDHACQEQNPDDLGGNVVTDCEELVDPTRTMLGFEQEQWFLRSFGRNGAKWNVIAQSLMMARRDDVEGGDPLTRWNDNWGGYQASHRRILDRIKQLGTSNPVSIGGDIHGFWVSGVPQYDDPAYAPVMSEFVCTSITSQSFRYAQNAAILPYNPHIKFFDDRMRGYVLNDITQDRWRATMRVADNVRDPDAGFRTLKTFEVADGVVGPVEV